MTCDIKTFEDAFNLMCGEKIGGGMSRIVFQCTLNPEWVVKVEDSPDYFQNVREWSLWQAAKDWDAAAVWLAPCHFISPNGRVLIQSKTEPLRKADAPGKMPVWLCDFKLTNYGLLKGKVVCHDYGTALIHEYGFYTKRMQNVATAWHNPT